MSQLSKKQQAIVDVFDDLDDGEISTERLLSMPADACGCDVCDVIDALKANA